MSKIIKIIADNSRGERDYYCAMKFRYLKIDPESKTVFCCHAAEPHPVDFNWLSENPGQLFNDPINSYEREQMLNNQRNQSCEQNCWYAEDIGAVSPRLYQHGYERTHIQVNGKPDIVEFAHISDCNLSCSYCCKEYSSTWRQDLVENGSYKITNYNDERYQLTDRDKILHRVSQPELKNSKHYQLLMEEFFDLLPGLTELNLTGGEPFLDNKFFDLFCERNTNHDMNIQIYTGLKVDYKRLDRILTKLSKFKNLYVMVSGENVGRNLEFHRYGIRWADYLDNINLIKSKNINIKFHATVSALTIFGFVDFATFFKNEDVFLSFAYQPRFIAPHIIDPASKELIKKQIGVLSSDWQEKILHSISKDPTDQERINLGEFITQFVQRRPDLSYDVFPSHFLEWLDIHVV